MAALDVDEKGLSN